MYPETQQKLVSVNFVRSRRSQICLIRDPQIRPFAAGAGPPAMFLRRSILAGSAVVLLCASSGEAFAPSSLPGRVATPRALSQLRMVRTPPPVEDGTLEDGSADDSRRAFIGKLGLGAASLVGVRKIADGGVYLDSPDLSGKQARQPKPVLPPVTTT